MTRYALVVTNAQTRAAAKPVLFACEYLSNHGFKIVFEPGESERLAALIDLADLSLETLSDQAIEIGVVLGGDGSILRTAEVLRDSDTPILGINLGHVGFMAEAESVAIEEALEAVVANKYLVRNRLALEVVVLESGKETFRSWALNEVTVEKSARERMLEVVLEIDSRPLSSFGCDGVLVATPTGSTAYAFSAGGPVIWPNVEALMLIPLSAHALFARPLVVGPKTELAIEVLRRSAGSGVLWCDGRRTFDLGPGSRVQVAQSAKSVPMVVLEDTPFADRLVRKFSLPVTGWRGPDSKP